MDGLVRQSSPSPGRLKTRCILFDSTRARQDQQPTATTSILVDGPLSLLSRVLDVSGVKEMAGSVHRALTCEPVSIASDARSRATNEADTNGLKLGAVKRMKQSIDGSMDHLNISTVRSTSTSTAC